MKDPRLFGLYKETDSRSTGARSAAAAVVILGSLGLLHVVVVWKPCFQIVLVGGFHTPPRRFI